MRKEKVIDMEKKKLLINAAVCDARNVSEATLEAYEEISINSAIMLVTQEAKDLMAKYNVTMNAADVVEVPKEAGVLMQNGRYEISDSTVLSKPMVLIVNGRLDIKTRSKEVLDKIIFIQVNGSVSYPSDIKDMLPLIKVNGSTDSYPGDAIKLKNKLIMDKTFILRAKAEKYYVRNKVIISDKNLNIASLKELGTKFITKRAIIDESLLEETLPLFDEQVEINTIPDGLTYIGSEILNDVLIRKYGDKLYVDGDLTINNESEDALDKLRELKVEGTVLINDKFIERLHNINSQYNDIEIIKGISIGDKAFVTIDKRKLDKNADGIRVIDCGIVNIKDDIGPDEIEEKLEFIDCGVINCSEEQKSAVETVSKDVGMITDGHKGKMGTIKELLGGLGLSDKDTKVINAANYTM